MKSTQRAGPGAAALPGDLRRQILALGFWDPRAAPARHWEAVLRFAAEEGQEELEAEEEPLRRLAEKAANLRPRQGTGVVTPVTLLGGAQNWTNPTGSSSDLLIRAQWLSDEGAFSAHFACTVERANAASTHSAETEEGSYHWVLVEEHVLRGPDAHVARKVELMQAVLPPHPNVVRYRDVFVHCEDLAGETDAAPDPRRQKFVCIVMEWCEHGSLLGVAQPAQQREHREREQAQGQRVHCVAARSRARRRRRPRVKIVLPMLLVHRHGDRTPITPIGSPEC